jgi:hypothetical protein
MCWETEGNRDLVCLEETHLIFGGYIQLFIPIILKNKITNGIFAYATDAMLAYAAL